MTTKTLQGRILHPPLVRHDAMSVQGAELIRQQECLKCIHDARGVHKIGLL